MSTSSAIPPASNIRVLVRVRPQNAREQATGGGTSSTCLLASPQQRQIEFLCKPDRKTFQYDHVVDETASQEEIFQKVGKPITDACMQGYNGTIFAYGQTGSGKTHTIQGQRDDSSSSSYHNEQRGLMPRVFEYLMASIADEERRTASAGGANQKVKYRVTASFSEIYNERIFDLLEPSASSTTPVSTFAPGLNSGALGLNLRTDTQRGVYVDGLTEIHVSTAAECEELMMRGAQARRVGETALNRESSRSHSVFTLNIKSTQTQGGRTIEKTAKFHVIDLAGSERAKATQAAGTRLDEAKNINRSLSALGNVIRELVKRGTNNQRNNNNNVENSEESHIPYRDSRLTFLLKDSLGGNSLTYLVACVSSSQQAFFESLSTLKFATMASAVKNCAKVNEDARASMEALKEENEKLKETMAKLLAAQQLGMRRMSTAMGLNTVTTTGPLAQVYANARDSCIGISGAGLLSPSKLRNGGNTDSASTAAMNAMRRMSDISSFMQVGGTNGTASSAAAMKYHTLFTQSHAREQAWLEEIHIYTTQLELLERREKENQMMLRMKEMRMKQMMNNVGQSSSSSSSDEQLLTLQKEYDAYKAAYELTLTPSLIDAQKKVWILKDLLMKDGITGTGENEEASSTTTPAHHRDFTYQKLITELQQEVASLSSDLSLAEMKHEDALQVKVDELTKDFEQKMAEKDSLLQSEQSLLLHIETQLQHTTSSHAQQVREMSEKLLLKQGMLLRCENERDLLKEKLNDLEAVRQKELEHAAQVSETAEAEVVSISSRLMNEITSLQTKLLTSLEEIKEKDDVIFEKDQTMELMKVQKEELALEFNGCKVKLSELEVSSKQTNDEHTRMINDLQLQVTQLQSDLTSSQHEATESRHTVNSLQSELTSSLSQIIQLQTELDETVNKCEQLREEQETLEQQGEYQKEELVRVGEVVKEKDTLITSLETQLTDKTTKLVTSESLITQLRSEAESTLKQRNEESISVLVQEKHAMQAQIDDLLNEVEAYEMNQHALESDLAKIVEERKVMEEDVRERQQKIMDLTQAYQHLSTKYETVQNESESMRVKYDAVCDQYSSLQTEHTSLQNQHDVTLDRLTSVESSLELLTEEKADLIITRTRELEESNERLDKLSGHVKEVEVELERMRKEKEVMMSEKVVNEKEIVEKQTQVKELQSELQNIQVQLTEVQSTLTISSSTITTLTSENTLLSTKLHDILCMAESLKTEKDDISHALLVAKEEEVNQVKQKEEREKQAVIEQLKDSQVKIGVLTQELTATTTQLHSAQADLSHSRAQFTSLQSTLEQLDGLRTAREEELKNASALMMKMKEEMMEKMKKEEVVMKSINERDVLINTLRTEIVSLQSQLTTASQDSTICLQLQNELSELQEKWSSSLTEKEMWIKELEQARQEESKMMSVVVGLKAEVTKLNEAVQTYQTQLTELQTANTTLSATNAQLIGHQNSKQKIQLHQQIKLENETLRKEKGALEREVKMMRKRAGMVGERGGKDGTSATPSSTQLEKELLIADEHIRAGEQAQIQLQAICERIIALDGKVKMIDVCCSGSSMEKASVMPLGDITNQVESPSSATTTPDGVVKSPFSTTAAITIASPSTVIVSTSSLYPSCLSTLSSFSACLARLSSQLESSRRDASVLRNQAKLQALKEQLNHQKQSTSATATTTTTVRKSIAPVPVPMVFDQEEQENQ